MQKLTDDQLEEVAQIALDHYQGQKIDWENLIDRAEDRTGVDFGNDMRDPEIERVKRYVRRARREANA